MPGKSKEPSLDQLVAAGRPRPWRRWLLGLLLLGLLGGGGWWWVRQRDSADAGPRFQTEPVERGSLELTVSATGNLEPINQVTVGVEISGTVAEVLADTNDRVTRGQVLARLDTTKLEQEADRTRAALDVSRARVLQAQATINETAANLARLQELHRLSGGRTPAQVEIDAAVAAGGRAEADLASAEADVRQSEAAVKSIETDLRRLEILSPVDGIVLTRKVEVGQTVAATFSAPELFVLAESLETMKLEVEVSEADIAKVEDGMTASFRVDAWPGRLFTASVEKVAFGSTNATTSSSGQGGGQASSSGVVTYTAELSVPNQDLSLRPGMTATAEIRVQSAADTLLVPNAALRFIPQDEISAAPKDTRNFLQRLMPMPQRRRGVAGGKTDQPPLPPGHGRVWLLQDDRPRPLEVTVGLTDGNRTEVAAATLDAGAEVIVRQQSGEGRGSGGRGNRPG